MFDKDVFTKDFVISLSTPSNFRLGSAIFDRNAIEVLLFDEDLVQAWVGGLFGQTSEGGGSRRKVTFRFKDGILEARCSCNPKNHQIFCKHCVALALSFS